MIAIYRRETAGPISAKACAPVRPFQKLFAIRSIVAIDPHPTLLLLAGNGFFVAAEFALVKVRPTQIEPYAAAGLRRAKVAQHMIHHLDSYLSATQLGITLASLALGWVGEPAFAWIVRPAVVLLTGEEIS